MTLYGLRKEIQNLGLDKFFLGLETFFDEFESFGATATSCTYPPFNLIREKDRYVIELAVAGFGEEDINIKLDGSNLTITGNRASVENESQDETLSEYIYQGVAGRSFTRSFRVGSDVTQEQISAELNNGILRITVLKKEKAEAISIKIKGK